MADTDYKFQFKDSTLEKIFSHPDMVCMPVCYQSSIVHIVEDALEEDFDLYVNDIYEVVEEAEED